MNLDDIRNLYAYNLWANRRMFSVMEKLSAEKLAAPVQSSFPSIRESVVHILGAEWLWLKRWTGIFPRATGPYGASTIPNLLSEYGVPGETLSTLQGMRSFSEEIHQQRQEFIGTLDEERLHAPLSFNDMSGNRYSDPLVKLMQHVVNHGTYHRGQVTTLLRQAGGEPVSLDMLYFFREQDQPAKAS
jgi:uncharacterized damage-inducible protein DinB